MFGVSDDWEVDSAADPGGAGFVGGVVAVRLRAGCAVGANGRRGDWERSRDGDEPGAARVSVARGWCSGDLGAGPKA